MTGLHFPFSEYSEYFEYHRRFKMKVNKKSDYNIYCVSDCYTLIIILCEGDSGKHCKRLHQKVYHSFRGRVVEVN